MISSSAIPLTGVICPTVTPLDENEGLDTEVFHRLLSRVMPKVDALMLLGTTGELQVLDPSVADRVVDVALEVTEGNDVPIVLGVGGVGWAQTLRNLRRVKEGIDAVAVSMPYYYPTTPWDLQTHIERVMDNCDAPIVLYNIPQNTHQEFDLDLVADLSQHPRVIAIKDSGVSREYFEQLLKMRSTTFTVLRGTDLSRAGHYCEAGSDGFVNGLENVAPGITRAVLTEETAVRAEGYLRALENGTGGPTGLALIKLAVAYQLGGTGRTAGAVASVGPGEAARFKSLLDELGLGSETLPHR